MTQAIKKTKTQKLLEFVATAKKTSDITKMFGTKEWNGSMNNLIKHGAVSKYRDVNDSDEKFSRAIVTFFVATGEKYDVKRRRKPTYMELANDLDRLRAFAGEVMEIFPEGGSLDAFDIQEMAAKHGLLSKEIMHEPCGIDGECQCFGYYDTEDFKSGIECYRRTKLLTMQK